MTAYLSLSFVLTYSLFVSSFLHRLQVWVYVHLFLFYLHILLRPAQHVLFMTLFWRVVLASQGIHQLHLSNTQHTYFLRMKSFQRYGLMWKKVHELCIQGVPKFLPNQLLLSIWFYWLFFFTAHNPRIKTEKKFADCDHTFNLKGPQNRYHTAGETDLCRNGGWEGIVWLYRCSRVQK